MQMHNEREGLMVDHLSTPTRFKSASRCMARLGVASLLVAMTTAAGGGGSDSLHSLDRTSASAQTGKEVYEDSAGPAVNPVISSDDLELVNSGAIDALSTGRESGVAAILATDGHWYGMGGPHIRYQFSADRIAVDDFEGTVLDALAIPIEIQRTDEFHEQFELNDQAADILDNVGFTEAGILYRVNFLQIDEEKLELIGGSAAVLSADDIDGFTSVGAMGGSPDSDDDGELDHAVYFSVDGLSGGMHPANIYVKRPGEERAVYASFLELGLDFLDDIDALSIWDATENGVFDEGDGVVFSLRQGSSSLPITVGATTITAGGVIFATTAGGFEDALPAGFFSLQDSDELDAVHVVDPRELQLPCEGEVLVCQPVRPYEALVATPSTIEITYEGACTDQRHIGVALNHTFRSATEYDALDEYEVIATSSDPSVVVFAGSTVGQYIGPADSDSWNCGGMGGMGGGENDPGAICTPGRVSFGARDLFGYVIDEDDQLLVGANRCLGGLEVKIVGVGTAEIEISCVAKNQAGVLVEVISDTVRVVVNESTGQIFGTCGPLANAPCGNTSDDCSGCRNSTFAGGRLRAIKRSGLLASTAAAESLPFHVSVSNLPAGAPVLLFTGVNQLNGGQGFPFGNGLRCVGGSLKRLGVRFADAGGSAAWVRIPPIEIWGSTPNFGDSRSLQGWYREVDGGHCGGLFNLTNGYAVTYGA